MALVVAAATVLGLGAGLRALVDQGFAAGGQNIHYLEKRLAERKNKTLAIG